MRRDCAVRLGLAVVYPSLKLSQTIPLEAFGMRCPSCSAPIEPDQEQCSECGASVSVGELLTAEADLPPNGSSHHDDIDLNLIEAVGASNEPQTSRLIEFPGVSRSALPQWRQQLSERVREVQEKRAREAALEKAEKEQASGSPPQLELLPQVDVPPVNPLVSAALKRIERAHQHTTEYVTDPDYSRAVPAVACIGDKELSNGSRSRSQSSVMAAVDFDEIQDMTQQVETAPAERVHNLVVVPPSIINENDSLRTKPRRMISDDPNDPALNYLDSVCTTMRVESAKYKHAPAGFRFLGAIVDLLVVAFFCAPFAAVVELSGTAWQNWRIAAIAVGIFCGVSFIYLTISTALTGRTAGTRLFSLRIVDSRTGLIPTGKQSAGRAVVYLASLLTLGIVSVLALMDSDKRTAHDRLTNTAVIAV
jgi:uncharacterized RDD family membrane protein YckC